MDVSNHAGFRAERVKSARMSNISVARAVVTRAATGKTEVYYSHDRVPPWQPIRFLKLHRHLRFMRAEDRKAGYATR